MSGQNDETKPEVGACVSGCGCGSAGVGSRSKWLIGGAVVLISCLVVAARFSGAKEVASPTQDLAQPVAAPASAAQPATEASRDTPRKGFSKSNVMATNTNKMRRTLVRGVSRSSRTLRPVRARSGCGAGGCGPKGCGSKPQAGYDMGLPKTESTVRDTGLEATAK